MKRKRGEGRGEGAISREGKAWPGVTGERRGKEGRKYE